MSKEIYRLDIDIGVTGDGQSKQKLSKLERYVKKSEDRLKRLDRMAVSPGAKLKDQATKPIEKLKKSAKQLDKKKINPEARLKDKMSGQLGGLKKRVGSFKSFALKSFGTIAAAGLLALGGIGITDTIQTYAQFEQGMADVQATTMATDAELRKMTDSAKQLGKTTSFSAREAAEGMNYLGMA